MKEFDDFLKSGEVRRQEKNEILAEALIKSSEKSLRNIRRTKIDGLNAESIISDIYDIMRELIEAKLAFGGYKSYSHEATILFLKKFPTFNEYEMNFLDNLRKIRNGIKYYGKEANVESALKTLNFMNSVLPKLKSLVKDAEK